MRSLLLEESIKKEKIQNVMPSLGKSIDKACENLHNGHYIIECRGNRGVEFIFDFSLQGRGSRNYGKIIGVRTKINR